ncbi:Zn(II)2Cys6 transcription factor [Aspergillus undulatus]|uniref:Zn(II)2Cys6 transcription factor n=1 Tax=Aspergillus undulatus TaxID=1810928 RepID=UPI003CCD7EDE
MAATVSSKYGPSQRNSHCPSSGPQLRKLRDSCIHCAASKVKCNKEKPVCSRCVRRRLECEYKVSRRAGRTSQGLNQTSGLEAVQEPLTIFDTSPAFQPSDFSLGQTPNILSARQDPFGSAQTSVLTPMTAKGFHDSSTEPSITQTSDPWRSFLSPNSFIGDVSDLTSFSPIAADVDDIFASVMPSTHFRTCNIDTMARRTESNFSAPDNSLIATPACSDAKSMQPDTKTTDHPTSCLLTVLEILKNFPSASTACNSPGGQPKRSAGTLETVVSENKRIINTINSVLDCPCSYDGYVISIASLAVFKIMGRYAAAVRTRIAAMEDSMVWERDAQCHTDRAGHAPFEGHVMRPPALVGEYFIDSGNQNRMAAQLVLSELHQVQRLVNVLASRLERIRLSRSAFLQLDDDLRKRLRSVSSEMIELLRRA